VASLIAECEEARQTALHRVETPQCSAAGLLVERPQTTNNTQVNITSDIDAARRIGYIMAKGLQILQMKQIEGKVEEEGK
jgi:hypothetical protein